jgi:hypothetical protein
MTSGEKTEALLRALCELSLRPWLVAQFREDPAMILDKVPGLTEKELESITRGNKGLLYQLLSPPFWTNIAGRGASFPSESAIAVDANVDINHAHLDLSNVEPPDLNELPPGNDDPLNFENDNDDDRGRAPGLAEDVVRRVEEAARRVQTYYQQRGSEKEQGKGPS